MRVYKRNRQRRRSGCMTNYALVNEAAEPRPPKAMLASTSTVVIAAAVSLNCALYCSCATG
jgi:hypothetical protein